MLTDTHIVHPLLGRERDMELTEELLAANNGKIINVALLVPDLEVMLDEAITHEIEFFADHFYETTGEDPQKWAESRGKDFVDYAEYDYHELLMEWAETSIDIINERLDGAVNIHSFDRSEARRGTALWGKEQTYLPALIDVDAGKLLDMYVERFDSVDIDDGHSTSGFIRTCDDSYWALISVLQDLITGDYTQDIVEDVVWEWSELEIEFGEAQDYLMEG